MLFLCDLHVGPRHFISRVHLKFTKITKNWNLLFMSSRIVSQKKLTFPLLHFTRPVKLNPLSFVIVAGAEGVSSCKHFKQRRICLPLLWAHSAEIVIIWQRRHTCSHATPSLRLPCGLQHHDRVLALVRARGRELHVDVGQAAAAGVAVASAGHAAHLDAGVRHPGSEGLQACRQCVELQRGYETAD